MDSTTDEDCPVCRGPLQNPSPPVPCCRKVFCHSCLRQAVLCRPQCPYCRSPLNNRAAIVFRNAVRCGIDLQGASGPLQTSRTVSPSLQVLLNRLSASAARAARTNANPPNQAVLNTAAQDTALPAVRAPRRPVPTPRARASFRVASHVPLTPMPNPVTIQRNPSPPSDLTTDEIYGRDWQPYIPVMTFSGNTLRTYSCPYCQEGGLDDLNLRDHCNQHHINDRRQVVCPVCVSLPHGNPTYCSRDFIGHLNLRHSYYIDDITNVYQSDDVNLQDAIIRSWQQK